MTKCGALLVVLGSLVVAALAPSVSAQDGQDLKQALDLYRQGKLDEGLQVLNKVLASNPSDQAAYQLRETLSYDQWVEIMIKGGQHEAAVTALFDRALPARKARTADAAAIKEKVEKLLTGDLMAKRQARLALFAEHGEYAVPVLADGLGDAADDRRVSCLWEVTQLGTQAVFPLIEVLRSSNELVVANAARALGNIGDTRALAYLQGLATDGAAPDLIRRAAAEAFGKLTNGAAPAGSPVPGLLDLAERLYARDDTAVKNWDDSFVVWNMTPAGLAAHEVPKDVYHLKLAEKVARDALVLDPTNFQGHVLAASCYLAMSLGGAPAGDDDASKAVAAALSYAAVLGAEAGPQVLQGVVAKAMNGGRAEVGCRALQLLGTMLKDSDLAAASPLTDALAAPVKSLRYAAALAVCTIHPRACFPNCDRVVPNLIQALGEDAVRQIVVVDDNPATRNQLVADLNNRNYFAVGTETGVAGFTRLKDYPVEDMVIVRWSLKNMAPADLAGAIKSDPATEKVLIVALCDPGEKEKCQEAMGTTIAGVIEAPLAVDAFEPQIRAAFPAEMGAARDLALSLAAAAAECLARLKPAGECLVSAPAAPALAACLTKHDSIREPAIRALGAIGDPGALAGLREILANASAPEALRAAAAVAIGKIAAAMGSVPTEVKNDLAAILGGDSGWALHFAVGQAIGLAPFTPAERVALWNVQKARTDVDLVK